MRDAGGGRGRRQRGLSAAACASWGICLLATSCMQVKMDLTRLEQPVVMNANPSLCASASPGYPHMTVTGVYTGRVSQMTAAASGGGGSSSSSSQVVNTMQVNAFQCIGGDTSATITGVRLRAESVTVNLLFAMMCGSSLEACGSVQRIEFPASGKQGGRP